MHALISKKNNNNNSNNNNFNCSNSYHRLVFCLQHRKGNLELYNRPNSFLAFPPCCILGRNRFGLTGQCYPDHICDCPLGTNCLPLYFVFVFSFLSSAAGYRIREWVRGSGHINTTINQTTSQYPLNP